LRMVLSTSMARSTAMVLSTVVARYQLRRFA